MTPDETREPRDERGPDDDRDERDPRLLGDPRDKRDPRTDPAERWGRYATRGQLFSVAAATATVTAAIMVIGFVLYGSSQKDLCEAVQGNQQQIRRVIDPALRFPDPVKARAEMDGRTRAVYRRTLPNVTDAAIDALLIDAAEARKLALDEFPPVTCSGPSI